MTSDATSAGCNYAQKAAIESGPHGWIQWKGTDVCMDIRCDCGNLHHLDGDFAYHIKVPCGRIYRAEPEIVLTLVDAVPSGWCEPVEAES